MREYVGEIVELLNELVDPEVQADPSSFIAIVQDVATQSQAAFEMSAAGMAKQKALMDEIEDLQAEYEEQIRKAKEQAEKHLERAGKHQKTADSKRTKAKVETALSVVSGAAPVAQAGVGMAGAVGGAALVAEIPLVGGILTTTTTTGWIFTSTVVAFNPVGVAMAVGIGGVAAVTAISHVMSAKDASQECRDALDLKEAAEKDADDSHGVVEKAEQRHKVAAAMLAKSEAHKDMWEGMSMSAKSAARQFVMLKTINPTTSAARREKFNTKMEKGARAMLNFAQASPGWMQFN